MKSILSKSLRWVMALLGIGAVACDKEGGLSFIGGNGGDVVCMYGVPTAEFRVKGRVLDEDKNPVPGIAVTNAGAEEVMTSEDGSFTVRRHRFSFGVEPKDTLVLNFHDIDGVENGGQFEDRAVTVECVKTSAGEGPWNNGIYEADAVSVNLKKK